MVKHSEDFHLLHFHTVYSLPIIFLLSLTINVVDLISILAINLVLNLVILSSIVYKYDFCDGSQILKDAFGFQLKDSIQLYKFFGLWNAN